MIFYTADLHLGHENVIAYSNRPFSNAAEMLECIILNWNSIVSADDDVYIIGDMFFKINSKEQLEILRRLKGRKHLILGNHDRDFNSNIRNEFAEITDEGITEHAQILDTFTENGVLIHVFTFGQFERAESELVGIKN